MIGKLNISKGGIDINGIIEEYTVASGGNVSAGDFVEFVNDYDYEDNSDTAPKISSMVALNENTVFYLYMESSYYKAILYNLETKQSTTPVQVSNYSSTNQFHPCTIKLDEENVFICFVSTSQNAEAIVCNCSQNSISISMSSTIFSAQPYVNGVSARLLSDNRIFVSFALNNTNAKVRICTINSNSIGLGTLCDLGIKDTITGYQQIDCEQIDDNRVFIGIGNSYYFYGFLCNVNNTNITKLTSTTINVAMGSSSNKVYNITMSSYQGRIFATIGTNISSDYPLYGTLFTFNGNSIYNETLVELSSEQQAAIYNVINCWLNSTTICILCRGGFIRFSIYSTFNILDTISVYTFSNKYDIPLGSATKINSGKLFYYQINFRYLISQKIRKTLKYINGVSIDNGIANENKKIIVPIYE